MEGAESDVSGFFAPILRQAGCEKKYKSRLIYKTSFRGCGLDIFSVFAPAAVIVSLPYT